MVSALAARAQSGPTSRQDPRPMSWSARVGDPNSPSRLSQSCHPAGHERRRPRALRARRGKSDFLRCASLAGLCTGACCQPVSCALLTTTTTVTPTTSADKKVPGTNVQGRGLIPRRAAKLTSFVPRRSWTFVRVPVANMSVAACNKLPLNKYYFYDYCPH